MIRVVHASDLHLDKEIFKEDARVCELRKKDLRSLFANLMMYVRDQKVDVLLLSGDLFDRKMPEKETLELVKREFQNTTNTEIFIAPGRNDPYRPGSVYFTEEFPENVHIFKSERVTSFEIERLSLTVYGYAFCRRQLRRNPFAVMPPVDKKKINLLCGYGSLSGEEGLCPITEEEIAHTGVDYLAIGGTHAAGELMTAGSSYYAIAGSPEGLSFEEQGMRGARIVALDKTSGELLLQSKSVRFSRRRMAELTLNVTGYSLAETEEQALEACKKEGYDSDTFLKLTLTGNRDMAPEYTFSDLPRLNGRLAYLTVEDRTLTDGSEGGEVHSFKETLLSVAAERYPNEEERSDLLKCIAEVL